MTELTRFVCVYDAACRLWHFTEDTEPRGQDIYTSCEHSIIFPSEGYSAFHTKDFSELEMYASAIFCPQCRVLGRHAFAQLRDDLNANQLEKPK